MHKIKNLRHKAWRIRQEVWRKKSKIKITYQNSKFLNFALSFCILIFAFCISCYAQDKIIAIVNNDIITQKDLNDFINFIRMQLMSEYKEEQLENKIQSIKSDLLDKLIEDRLILQEARKNNVRIDENRVKTKMDEIKKQFASDIVFQNTLSQQGLVQADIESRIREQLIMYNIIDIKVRNKIVVSPREVTDFYQKNIEEFNISSQREFEAIAIEDENLAKEIYNHLKNGQASQDLAKAHSLSVNRLTAMKGELRKDIEDVVFNLNLAQISEPIKIQDSYYIFKLDNIIPARQQNLSEVQDNIYRFLFEKKMQEKLTKWLDELKRHSYIKIFQD